jgi:hypothetical protein
MYLDLRKSALERGLVLNSIGGATGFVFVEVTAIFALGIVVNVNKKGMIKFIVFNGLYLLQVALGFVIGFILLLGFSALAGNIGNISINYRILKASFLTQSNDYFMNSFFFFFLSFMLIIVFYGVEFLRSRIKKELL